MSAWREELHPRDGKGEFTHGSGWASKLSDRIGSDIGEIDVVDKSDYHEPVLNERDPVARAADFYSDTIQGMNLIRAILRNRAAGKEDFDFEGTDSGYDLSDLRKHLIPTGKIRNLDGDVVYDENSLKKDLSNAATLIGNRLENPPRSKSPLFRGVGLDLPDIPEVGDEFNNPDISSWSSDQKKADKYGNTRIKLTGSVPALDLGKLKRNSRTGDDGEHLVPNGTRFKVVAVHYAYPIEITVEPI
jgi:hypothetical protein